MARGLTDESGREVLIVSGIFIAEFAETQRSQRRAFLTTGLWRFSGDAQILICRMMSSRTATRHGSETFSLRSLRLSELCDKYTRSN